MPDEAGKSDDLSKALYGLAPHPEHLRAKWHLWAAVPAHHADPGVAGVKTFCGGFALPTTPAAMPHFQPMNIDAPIQPSTGVLVCPLCQHNWLKRQSSAASLSKRKRREQLEDSASLVLASLSTVRKTNDVPATWHIRIGAETYIVSTDDIFDHEAFARWYMEKFQHPLTLDRDVWTDILEAIGKRAKEEDADSVPEETLMREVVCDKLAHYRIAPDRAAIDTKIPFMAFKEDGNTWVRARSIIDHLKEAGYKVDHKKVASELKGVVIGRPKEFKVYKKTWTCWPVDAELVGLPSVEEKTKKNNGDSLPAGQVKLDAGDEQHT